MLEKRKIGSGGHQYDLGVRKYGFPFFDPKAKGYLQVDETTIKVLDSDKKGAAHLVRVT